MTTPILVTGGTGTLGGHVLPLLRDAGRDLRVLSRRERAPGEGVEYVTGDLLTGDGVDAAVGGVETILHLAGGARHDDRATAALAGAAARAGVRHLVLISVVAADKVPLAYFRYKLGAERAVADSGVPWTVLRAAQFHDLALMVAEKMTKLPVVPAPGGVRWEPVDSREVAARLVELTLGEPAGRVADLSGPEIHTLADLCRGYLRAQGGRRPMLPVRVPGKLGRAYRTGANLAAEGADRGTLTWENFLTEQVSRRHPRKPANKR
ncbi:SDR family oxidoreductase [Actinomadura roseirufa]|uniref:SDR family oxidoreductase n=1 Tax=Actinomadura roseirufa TaxID=2094049 RepID=UPI001040F7C5|nr:SDR family oxidoreductase [Actinomadura roseirufa]